jgi:hypothetical protein
VQHFVHASRKKTRYNKFLALRAKKRGAKFSSRFAQKKRGQKKNSRIARKCEVQKNIRASREQTRYKKILALRAKKRGAIFSSRFARKSELKTNPRASREKILALPTPSPPQNSYRPEGAAYLGMYVCMYVCMYVSVSILYPSITFDLVRSPRKGF